MKKLQITFGLIVGLIVLGFIQNNNTPKPIQKVSATEFVTTLEKLGYYKYAEASTIDSLKNDLIKNYDPTNEFVTIWNEDSGVPLDYRYYWCDGETVFEAGGFIALLEQVQPTLHKIGLKIHVTNHFEEWDQKNEWLNHRITINGAEYVIFKNFKDYGWAEAVMRFAQIINQEAKNQGVEDLVYLASAGNDGRLIFLNQALYNYIYSVYTNQNLKPLEVNEWIKVMKS
ncbi:hypothetical protein HNV08_05380 [Winogradskyella eckloniae]|uniref:hypothetical protein n=1 Tax=Winogradskyella eckloniae TaxID=1089306 RepID=UPI001563B410|nr:hypothetical protein [Winogradskyella eckloniae]NRD19471.1 hypothetical protein [Winogradskyella eckloniae]